MSEDDLKRLLEAHATETRRHFDVVTERHTHNVQRVAERILATTQKVVRLESALEQVGEEVEQLSTEMKVEFNEVRSMILETL